MLRAEIAERVRVEDVLRESRQQNEFLANIIELSSQPFGVGYPDGRIGIVNKAFEQLTGYSSDEVKLISWATTLTSPEMRDFERNKLEELHHTGQPVRYENEYVRKDGTRVPVELLVQLVTDPEGKKPEFYYAFLTDITSHKQAEQALRQAKEAAEAANRAKSQFLANMSHELRTPMTGVLGMLDLVVSGALEAKQREFIEAARKSARSLVQILNDILDLTKIESGRLTIDNKPFSIRTCLENIFNILNPAAMNKGLQFHYTVADDLPMMLVGDQTRLNQILTNLTGNAVKFTEKGEVAIRVAAGAYAPGGKREVTFTVTDTGIGVDDDKKDLLFNIFSQLDETHSREYGGTGLGLAICKELVERMGGTITFVSAAGKGSTFSFTIPFGEAETGFDDSIAPEEAAPTVAHIQPEEPTKPRLLIAEDDPTIRQVLGNMLQMLNFEIDFAENGQLTVEMWQSGNYDLILMDVQMPRMNGFEATAAIREIERTSGGHIPIVAMTAHALKKDEEKCLNAGMDAYVSKPIDFKKAVHVIRESLKKQAGFGD